MSNGRSSAGELLHAPSAHARPRGRAAEELSRSEERFFKVFQASPVAIILRTLSEGRVIDVNARYTELVGYRVQHEINSPFIFVFNFSFNVKFKRAGLF